MSEHRPQGVMPSKGGEVPTGLEPLVLQGNVLEVLKTLPQGSVHCVVTSPPFLWGLRRYDVCPCSTKRFTSETLRVWDGANRSHDSTGQGAGSDDPRTRQKPDPSCRWCGGTGTIPGQEVRWGGDPDCEHEWGTTPPRRTRTANDTVNPNSPSFGTGQNYDAKGGRICTKCGAWHGSLGIEPTSHLYVAHMVEVFRGLRRVLRDDGTIWCELGDTWITHPAGLTGAKRWKASGLSNRDNSGAEQVGSFDKRFGRIFAGRDMSGHATSGGMEKVVPGGLPEGSQTLIPHRVAIALQDDGWVLRQTYVWARKNPMPESVRNRGTTSHSYIFQLVKGRGYYYDRENGRETNAPSSAKRLSQPSFWTQHGGKKDYAMGTNPNRSARRALEHLAVSGLVGRNMLSVWDIPTQAFPGKHYATFPMAIPRRCISVGTSDGGCCPECGAPWRRIVESTTSFEGGSGAAGTTPEEIGGKWGEMRHGKNILLGPVVYTNTIGWTPTCGHYPDPCDRCGAAWKRSKVTRRVSTFNVRVLDAKAGRLAQKSGLGGEAADATAEEIGAYKEGSDAAQYRTEEAEVGWPSCSCLRPVPGVVLDPFAGSGTTLAVAKQLGRRAIGIELSPAYVEMARERVAEARTETSRDPAQRRLGEFEGSSC